MNDEWLKKFGKKYKNLFDNLLDNTKNSGKTEILDYSSEETMVTSLLIMNSIMSWFKNIYFQEISVTIYIYYK